LAVITHQGTLLADTVCFDALDYRGSTGKRQTDNSGGWQKKTGVFLNRTRAGANEVSQPGRILWVVKFPGFRGFHTANLSALVVWQL